MVGIYKIISPSGKLYIGKSKNIERRFSEHKSCKGNTAPLLYKSIRKYGAENHSFEIVQSFPEDVSRSVLDNYEIFIISQYKEGRYNMLNLAKGGTGGDLGEEINKLKRGVKTGVVPWNKGKQLPDYVKGKLSKAMTGRPAPRKGMKNTPEHIQKIKDWRKENPLVFTQETIDKIQATRKGYKHSDKTKAKIREKLMGHSVSDATRELWSKQRKGKKRA